MAQVRIDAGAGPTDVIINALAFDTSFDHGNPTEAFALATEEGFVELSSPLLRHSFEARDVGLVHRLDREDAAVTLARPPERIAAERLIQIGFDLVDEGRPEHRSRLLEPLRAAQREIARDGEAGVEPPAGSTDAGFGSVQ